MMKIKKALPFALIVVTLCTILALGVSATCDPYCDYHYEDITEATCTENGYRVYTCSICGDSYDDEIVATGHNYEGEVTESATCTESGTMTYTCEYCGDSYTESISPTGHNYEEYYVAPTCASVGYSCGKCIVCGYIDMTYGYTEVPALTYHEKYENGICVVCGASSAGSCTHTYKYESCGAETHISKCTKCGLTQGEEIGHAWSDDKTLVEDIDEFTAIYQFTCTDCGYVTNKQVSTACDGNHNWLYMKVDGTYHRQECTVCATTGATSAHTFDDGVLVQAPSLNQEGVTIYTCTLCGYHKEEITAALTIDTLLSKMTDTEANELFEHIFFYGAEEDCGKFQRKFMENTNIGYWYAKYFATEIFPDIAENGAHSEYYNQFKTSYYGILNVVPSNSADYQQGYNDAISSVIDKNPVQGLFQGMWSGVMLFITVLGNGIGIGGITLSSVIITLAVIFAAIFIVKITRK